MGVNSLPKTVTRQRRGCDLNPGPTAPESSALTTRLPSHPLGVSVSVSVSVDVLLCRAVSINPRAAPSQHVTPSPGTLPSKISGRLFHTLHSSDTPATRRLARCGLHDERR